MALLVTSFLVNSSETKNEGVTIKVSKGELGVTKNSQIRFEYAINNEKTLIMRQEAAWATLP
tara:strand:+ start:497 stop:682 length:186 start_codon:yes stop_codon:yes gene_type:complete